MSRDSEDRPVYGGTPSDFAVVQAIQEMKARGLRVTFYPFILMDVPPGNTLPNPYSDNAAAKGQSVFPWRGRITCSPAAGFPGGVDKTATAATQVYSLFGAAGPAQFTISGVTAARPEAFPGQPMADSKQLISARGKGRVGVAQVPTRPAIDAAAGAATQPAKTQAGLVGSERVRRHPHPRA